MVHAKCICEKGWVVEPEIEEIFFFFLADHRMELIWICHPYLLNHLNLF